MKEFKGYRAKIIAEDESQKVWNLRAKVSEISTETEDAIKKGWEPPALDKAVDWWAEVVRSDPGGVVEEYIDNTLDGKSTQALLNIVGSYYEIEAENFLAQLEEKEKRTEKVYELDPESCIGCPFKRLLKNLTAA